MHYMERVGSHAGDRGPVPGAGGEEASVNGGVRRRGAVAFLLVTAVALVGCGQPENRGGRWRGPQRAATPPPTVVVTAPVSNAKNVVTSAEIGLKTTHAEKTTVELTDAGGAVVPGSLRADGTSWVPGRQLAYGSAYRVKVTVTGANGVTATTATAFTTMAKPRRTTGSGLYLAEGETVGVGMPVVVEFTRAVADKAAVQRRLFVTSDPPVEGAWHWFSAKQVHFRPKEYWKPGTKITVRIAIGGMSLGAGYYGSRDRTATVTVGPQMVMEVDNKTKHMTVTKDGTVLRRIPVSLGKAANPSSSGQMVVMDKRPSAIFDSSSYGVPADSANGYRLKVYYALRITWSGQFIHAAPWSVGDQGKRNVSHGCVNVSTANGRWLFENTRKGDPVIVRGTADKLDKGNGWTDWDMTWEQYQAGSALA